MSPRRRKEPPLGLVPGLGGAGFSAGAGLLSLLWYSWYRAFEVKAPRIYVGDGALKEQVLPHCTLLQQPFKPTMWASHTHMQTVLGLMRKASIVGSYNRQLIMSSDGGTSALDWWMGCDKASFGPSGTPIFLVLHGINGGSHEGYCKWACATAAKKGWRSVVLNYRGCNGLKMTSWPPRGYNATMTSDVHVAIVSIRAMFPDAPIFAAGYSLGAVILTKYLSEADTGMYDPSPTAQTTTHSFKGSGLVAAAAVSSPVCLYNSMANLSRPWSINFLYNIAVAYKLREFVSQHLTDIVGTGPFKTDAALNALTIQEFEDQGAPAVFGYHSRLEYYEHASSLNYIPNIRTPTLMLVSTDDPFLGTLPDIECAANPSTVLAATSRGGHVAFLQGLWPFGTAYMDSAVMEFLDSAWKHYHPVPACNATGHGRTRDEDLPIHQGGDDSKHPRSRM